MEMSQKEGSSLPARKPFCSAALAYSGRAGLFCCTDEKQGAAAYGTVSLEAWYFDFHEW